MALRLQDTIKYWKRTWYFIEEFPMFPGTLLPGMITRYCVMIYLHEDQTYTRFTKWVNDEHVINFTQLAKNLRVQALCVVSHISNLWITIPYKKWWEILTISWFFIPFSLKLYFVISKPAFYGICPEWSPKNPFVYS